MPDLILSRETPYIAIFILVVLFLFLRILEKPQGKRLHRSPDGPYRPRSAPPITTLHPRARDAMSDAADQLRAVIAAPFTARNVLSKTEAAVMAAAEAAIAEAKLPWRVMAQVSLGEVLASPDEAAFRAINAKRVDLLVVSERSRPLAAIEYQGQGHYQGTAPARDAIKKEALRRAGIGYIEITFEHGPEDVGREIARLANKHRRDASPALPNPLPRN